VVNLRLISWNVNGIRAIEKKGFINWFESESPDILCLQETKAQPGQLSEALLKPKGYHVYWNSAEKKGYSGTVTYTKQKPVKGQELGIERFDSEGRTVMTEFENFILFNIYFPNGQKNEERLKYKLDFYDSYLKHVESLRQKGKSIILCGDVNTAHKPIDLARPKANEKVSGFLPVERKWLDKLVKKGYLDTFRHFCKEPDHYTWWDYITRARERNVGWRIDYFFITEDLLPRLKDAFILSDVMGSDHCPIGIEIR
jgi:exodeoxyribonuclease-3